MSKRFVEHSMAKASIQAALFLGFALVTSALPSDELANRSIATNARSTTCSAAFHFEEVAEANGLTFGRDDERHRNDVSCKLKALNRKKADRLCRAYRLGFPVVLHGIRSRRHD